MAFDPIGSMIFFPDPYLVATPGDLGLDYDDVELRVDGGGRSHGWFVPGDGDDTILWFHGNAGNISHRLDNLRLLHDLVGASILIIDYGGYGRSDGEPSEERMYADARAALHSLRERGISAANTVYFGRSLGSAVALDLAVDEPPAKLILETPFESLRAMAGALVPAPLARLVPQRFDNLGKIARIRCPVLFLHGDRDEIVPFEHSLRLYDAAPEPKRHYRIPGAGHNDTYVVGGAAYFETIRRFIEDESPYRS
jgi:fermentation-respiration switch protein FrsA (DUF1100 family)